MPKERTMASTKTPAFGNKESQVWVPERLMNRLDVVTVCPRNASILSQNRVFDLNSLVPFVPLATIFSAFVYMKKIPPFPFPSPLHILEEHYRIFIAQLSLLNAFF